MTQLDRCLVSWNYITRWAIHDCIIRIGLKYKRGRYTAVARDTVKKVKSSHRTVVKLLHAWILQPTLTDSYQWQFNFSCSAIQAQFNLDVHLPTLIKTQKCEWLSWNNKCIQSKIQKFPKNLKKIEVDSRHLLFEVGRLEKPELGFWLHYLR